VLKIFSVKHISVKNAVPKKATDFSGTSGRSGQNNRKLAENFFYKKTEKSQKFCNPRYNTVLNLNPRQ